jgi:hypothetical protein
MKRRLLLAALLLASMALSFVGEGNAGSTRAATAIKKTIRVMTFNIHVGCGHGQETRPAANRGCY